MTGRKRLKIGTSDYRKLIEDNGYFVDKAHIYNPWSIITFIERHTEGFKPYWVNTSSDELIKNRIAAKEKVENRIEMAIVFVGKEVYIATRPEFNP